MTPTKVVTDQLLALLAADPTTLAPAVNGNRVYLVAAAFTPGPLTDFALLTLATFTGSANKVAGTGTQQNFIDTVSGDYVVQLLEPAGGWHWQCTAAPGTPETIFGYVVTDNASAVTLGSGLFPTPIVITAIGDAVDIAEVRCYLPPTALSDAA